MPTLAGREIALLTRRRRRLRLLAPAALLLVVILLVALIANAVSRPGTSPPAGGGVAAARFRARPSTGAPRPVAVRLRARRTGTLSAALEDAAAASLGQGRVVLLGGLDGEDTSTATITMLADAARGTTATDTGARLPEPQHDAQAAALGGSVYVFGGGQVESYDHILRFDSASGRVSLVGQLPQPASDVAVTSIGNTAYIVGGYNGEHALDTILAWRPGASAAVVGRLPRGLRYAAIAATGSRVIIAGGSTEAVGSTEAHASRAILRFDPSTGRVTQIGSLPAPLTHSSAASLGGTVYAIGGRGSAPGSQTAAILAIDPASGRVRHVGDLAQPLSDAAVATVGGHILIAGGQSTAGTQTAIYELASLPG
jgi:N-acetylneuraminic acid mutarotase